MIIRKYAFRPRLERGKWILQSSALALTLALAACGGGEDASPTPQAAPLPTPPSVPPLSSGTPIVLSFGSTIGATHHWPDGDASTGGQGADVGSLSCLVNMPETYHVHAHLSIFLNGDQLIVPQRVGIPRDANGGDKCFYSLHTHDESGEVHVEGPAPATFTLGQLFDIWGQPLDATNVNVAGIVGLPITIYLVEDGDTKATVYTDDPRKIELSRHRQITIQIGTAISTIPVYDYAGA